MSYPLYLSELESPSELHYPFPEVSCSISVCMDCKYCCSDCEYVSEEGCQAPDDYELFSLCKSFPILMGHGESRNPGLGYWYEQFPPEFGAFVPLGRKCQAVADERQRIIFQLATNWLNQGKRNFTIYNEMNDYFLLITVKNDNTIKRSTENETPTVIVKKLKTLTV